MEMTDAEKLNLAIVAVEVYGDHHIGCVYDLGLGCDCGFHETLELLGIHREPLHPLEKSVENVAKHSK